MISNFFENFCGSFSKRVPYFVTKGSNFYAMLINKFS